MIRVTETGPCSYTSVYAEYELGAYLEYRRHSAGCWEGLYGMSWEEVYDTSEIETAYQEFLAAKEPPESA